MAVCCCSLAGTAACQHCRKYYAREEAKKRLMNIGVMDENENLIPPYDEIFIKKEKNDG